MQNKVFGVDTTREATVSFSSSGSPFFGVGPIADSARNEIDARRQRYRFEQWVEGTFRKRSGDGRDLGPLTVAELSRSMHRGQPADSVVTLLLQTIHTYFSFGTNIKLAIGLGGGHSGFTALAMNLIDAHDDQQRIFVDTPKPESEKSSKAGFFRQSWAAQLTDLLAHAGPEKVSRLSYADDEGQLPTRKWLTDNGVKIVFGVGHETTSATSYTESEILELLDWVDEDPQNHHFVVDATSLLGALPWKNGTIDRFMRTSCMFMPLQKAMGGVAGYYVLALTPQALARIDDNAAKPGFAIPRQLQLAVPESNRKLLSGSRKTSLGPIFDPQQGRMLGGVINTFALLALAETTFNIQQVNALVGNIQLLNERSRCNRDAIDKWLGENRLFAHAVSEPARRGAAVTLLRVVDPLVTGDEERQRIVANAKRRLGYEGYTACDGSFKEGVDVARYINAFPGSPGDFRAWIGGVRDASDILSLLDNIKAAYIEARDDILGLNRYIATPTVTNSPRVTYERAVRVLICDPVGLLSNHSGLVDIESVKQHIAKRGAVFVDGPLPEEAKLKKDNIYFSYQPDLSCRNDLLRVAGNGQFDAVIAAATEIPSECEFRLGGVRIGAGVGNMKSRSWLAVDGARPEAPLMNTPSYNSRVTAQSVIKVLLQEFPSFSMPTLHSAVMAGAFDTGRDLKKHPSEMIEGKRLAILGFGNIGREVARLASTLGMEVTIFAREKYKSAIESIGYRFCSSAEEASHGADVLSVHLGLGEKCLETGAFANAGFVCDRVLGALNNDAVIVNFDRGEVLSTTALQTCLARNQVRRVYVDADVFLDDGGNVTGPLAAYRPLAQEFVGKLVLLPHVVADTDHTSRVSGAMQAVDQIMDRIEYAIVRNLRNECPNDCFDAGLQVLPGVGPVGKAAIGQFMLQKDKVSSMRRLYEDLAALWGALDATGSAKLAETYMVDIVHAHNAAKAAIERSGLYGIVESY